MGAVLMSMLVSTTISIRVDWNTNKGPILPPTPTPPPPPPRRPYAEPAPVWEDQSNDIPNPNPYVYVNRGGLINLQPHFHSSVYFIRYVPPPPSRPKYNQNPTNGYTKDWYNDQANEISNDYDKYGQKYPTKQSNDGGFFVDVPPKFFKTASPAKQQYYQQQYLQDILNTNFYSQSNGKYNIIAFKNTYHNVPYYVVSSNVAVTPWPWQSRTFSWIIDRRRILCSLFLINIHK